MVSWKNPQVMAAEALNFNNVVHVFCGLYLWEILVSFYFEISLIQGKRKIGWPLGTPPFLSLSIWNDVGTYWVGGLAECLEQGELWGFVYIHIGTYFIFCFTLANSLAWIKVAGNTTIASASTSLMIRTIALWQWERWVTVTISILSLGQWGILIRGMNIVEAVWDESTNSCVVDNTNHLLLNLNYFYTMAFDFVILIFTAIVLGRFSRPNEGLSGLLFRDGLIYFLVTSMCNTIPAVLNLLNLNDEMNVIATVPAATTSAVAACRAVIRLKEYADRSSNSYSLPTLNFINTIASRYRSVVSLVTLCLLLIVAVGKASHPQTHQRSNVVSLNELETTSSADPNAPKLPTYVQWSQESNVSAVVEKTVTVLEPMPSKHDALVSVV